MARQKANKGSKTSIDRSARQTSSAPLSGRYDFRKRIGPLRRRAVRLTNKKGKKAPSNIAHPEAIGQPVSQNTILQWVDGVHVDIPPENIPTESSSCHQLPDEYEEHAVYSKIFGYQPSEAAFPNKKRIRPSDKGFVDELLYRNVNVRESANQENVAIADLFQIDRSTKPTKEEEENWKRDFDKCRTETEDDAQIKNTLLMELLGRHDLNPQLDYVCESTWSSIPIPREGRGEMIAQPNPSLAVAFKTSCLLPGLALNKLGKFVGHVRPEGLRRPNRAFHFFAVEAAGMQVEISYNTLHLKNLNTASQALYNMYLIMRKAGNEAIFFQEVRFFSAITTTSCFEVRVHRAVEDWEVSIGLDYPLSFHFKQLHRIEGYYSKAQASGIVKIILVEYGVKKLLPILKESLQGVSTKVRAEELKLASQAAGKRPATDPLESFYSQ